MRGRKCDICGAIGLHMATECPDRIKVGVPEVLHQARLNAVPALPPSLAAEPVQPSGPPLVLQSAGVNMLYLELPDDYIPASELCTAISRQPTVPECLRCYACGLLVTAPRWWSCCDVVVCLECLGPADAIWTCPLCNVPVNHLLGGENTVHAVTALEKCAQLWAMSLARAVDPYSKG